VIKKQSNFDVKTTMDRLESVVRQRGALMIARVDHAIAAANNYMDLRPTEIIMFGNPKLGTPLMQSNQLAAMDLPTKVLAWEDEHGKTWLTYKSPKKITEDFNINDQDTTREQLEVVLDNFTEIATSG